MSWPVEILAEQVFVAKAAEQTLTNDTSPIVALLGVFGILTHFDIQCSHKVCMSRSLRFRQFGPLRMPADILACLDERDLPIKH